MSTWRMSLGPEAILIRADLDLVGALKDLDAGLEAAIYRISSAPDVVRGTSSSNSTAQVRGR